MSQGLLLLHVLVNMYNTSPVSCYVCNSLFFSSVLYSTSDIVFFRLKNPRLFNLSTFQGYFAPLAYLVAVSYIFSDSTISLTDGETKASQFSSWGGIAVYYIMSF